MNRRIKELEIQAFDAVWDLEKNLIGPTTHFRPDGFEAKFAELILRDVHQYVDGLDTAQIISNGILRRYGMEE